VSDERHRQRSKGPPKKWPLRRAAKFREETPRKGGGLAIEDRDTALQQYEERPACLQAQKYAPLGIFSGKIGFFRHENYTTLPSVLWCDAINL
jgi:hypothetical protein